MSDDKDKKSLQDEELDKVSGGVREEGDVILDRPGTAIGDRSERGGPPGTTPGKVTPL
jgi:hypothetical protein